MLKYQQQAKTTTPLSAAHPQMLSSMLAKQRAVVGASSVTAAKPLMNGRLGPKQTTTTIGQQQQVSSSIPTPSPAVAALQQHRPVATTTVPTSTVGAVSHNVSHSIPMGALPTTIMPSPPETISTTPGTVPSSAGNSSSSKKKSGHPLRRGKWTAEEEAYAGRLIGEFKSGLLPLTDGTTLRNFLSKLLNCDPMRISKKFVGNNCIGKQVFRRRVADISRLTPDQIQGMRVELSELERRFFDRVAQTNRVKSPGVSSNMATGPMMTSIPVNTAIHNIINISAGGNVIREEMELERPPTPPWLRPPSTYKPKGKFAEKAEKWKPPKAAAAIVVPPVPPPPPIAASHLSVEMPPNNSNSNNNEHTVTGFAALLPKVSVSSTPPLVDVKSDTEKAMDAISRSGSSLGHLVQAAVIEGMPRTESALEQMPRTESALEQLARTASAAKFVEDIVNGDSSLDLDDTQTEDGKKLSQTKLQGSFEALMSMGIHSVENLVELASTSQSSALLSELSKSCCPSEGGGGVRNNDGQSSANLSSRMESFIKSLSNANLLKSGLDLSGLDSGDALGSLLNATSSNSLFDAAEQLSRRIESSTGFSQLRAEDGLANGSHNSVDDFLSLVASGDIPHQDPNMLNVPLQKVMQQNGIPIKSVIGSKTSKRKFSQQQLVALASRLAGSSSTNLSEMTCGEFSALKKRRKK